MPLHRLIEAGNDSCVIYRQSEARPRAALSAAAHAAVRVACQAVGCTPSLGTHAARLRRGPLVLSAVCLPVACCGFRVAAALHGSCCIARCGLQRAQEAWLREFCAESAAESVALERITLDNSAARCRP